MRELVDGVSDDCVENGENAFFVCDLGRVLSKHDVWKAQLGSERFGTGSAGVEAFFGKLRLCIYAYVRTRGLCFRRR
jgi:hypothetical protein